MSGGEPKKKDEGWWALIHHNYGGKHPGDNNPFVHRFSSQNKVIYIKKYYSFIDRNFFLWSNALEPDNIFFKSLLNSGELLKIKDKLLIKEIESIYTKQEERVSGFYNLRNTITQSTFAWYVEKSMNQQKTNSPFVNERDRELEVNLELRRGLITESIKSVQDYIRTNKPDRRVSTSPVTTRGWVHHD